MLLSFPVGPEESQQPGEGYPLKVVAEHVADDTQVTAALVWYCFVYPRTHMYFVKKKWGASYGLPPAAVLLEDVNGTSLSDGSIPEEMGWTIASPSDPPVCTVYAIPKFDEHAHNPQVKAGRPIVAQPLAAENPAVPSQPYAATVLRRKRGRRKREGVQGLSAGMLPLAKAGCGVHRVRRSPWRALLQ